MRYLAAIVAFGIAGIAGLACRTVETNNFSPADLGLIAADSEVFDAVVVPHAAALSKPFLLDRGGARFDSRPYGGQARFAGADGGSNGDSPSLFAVPESSTVARMIDVRRLVLKKNRLTEGGPFSFQNCAGTLTPPPPPSASSVSSRSSDLKAGCPNHEVTYISVGVPARGMPKELRQMQAGDPKPVDPSEVVWSVVVEESSAGSGGQNWQRHAWLLTRNPLNHRLEVAQTILMAWAE